MLEKLPPEKFKRIHRSYIVAIDKVKSLLNRKIALQSSKELPVSDSYSTFISVTEGYKPTHIITVSA